MVQPTKVYKGKEAREKMLAGMKEVFDTVKVTYGGNGRDVVFNKWSGTPVASNDGENISDQVIPEDLTERQGADLIKQVARNTNAELEDSSTATIMDSYLMARKGTDLIHSDPKISPMRLRKEMKEAGRKVIEELKASKIAIDKLEDLENLAITSVEDVEFGRAIAKAIYESGDSGIVYVNESNKDGVSVEAVDGYQFQQGLITQYLVKDLERMQTVLNDAAVLVTEMQITFPNNEFLQLIKEIVESGTKDILVICDELHPKIIEFAVMNMYAGKFNLCFVKKPMQKDYLEDIAAVVGAMAMTQNKGRQFPKMEYLGRAKKVVLKEKTTTIFIDDSKIESCNNYIQSLKNQLLNVEAGDEVTPIKIQERIARLTGGIFMVNVGAKTEAGLKYLRDKVDDAVNSLKKVWRTKDDGIVLGGGVALYNVGVKLLGDGNNLTNGEKVVYEICKSNLFQMLQNGGEDDTIITRIMNEGGGYNALTMAYEPDMFKAGIVDSTKVISTSFLNSVDFAADFVKYEIVITPIPQLVPIDIPYNKSV